MKRSRKNAGKFKVMFVCTGNICRSPMAVGILDKLFPESLMGSISITSSGTSAYPGSPPSRHAIDVCREFGTDISGHKSRRTSMELVDNADLILAMEPHHLDYIAGLDLLASERTFLLKEYKRNTGYWGEKSVMDPIAGDRSVYQSVFNDLLREIQRILPELEKTLKKRKEQGR